MFDNLNLRSKILAVAAVPVNVLALLALWAAAIAGQPVMAAVSATGAVATLVVASVVAARLLERLAALGDAVERLSTTELPQRIEGTYAAVGPTDETGTGEVDPSPVDEITELIATVGAIGHRAQIALDRRQQTSKKELTTLVRGLARRHQSLLDRQIDHIDWLEDTEQNPERLEQLFKLDHLATRLRRSSETVLVLAGSESTRPRGGPAPIATVLRVAMGETEEFTKIKLRAVDEVHLAAGPAFDVAHLVAELLENATQFSAPDTVVELHAVLLTNGDYQVTIVDRGFGMDAEQLTRANQILAEPPELDTSVGRSIGLIVIGRLAARIDATVELSPTVGVGLTATVVIPSSVVISTTDASRPAVPAQVTREAEAEASGSTEATASTDTGTETSATDVAAAPGALDETGDEAEPVATARGRVTEDSTNALSKLLGLGNAPGLAESHEWAGPEVETGTGQPLTARAAAPSKGEEAEAPSELDDESGHDSGHDAAAAGERAAGEQTAGDQPAGDEAESGGKATPRRTSRARRRPVSQRRLKASRTLAEAIPQGADFETGIESLLDSVENGGDRPVEPTTGPVETNSEPDAGAPGPAKAAAKAAEVDQERPNTKSKSKSRRRRGKPRAEAEPGTDAAPPTAAGKHQPGDAAEPGTDVAPPTAAGKHQPGDAAEPGTDVAPPTAAGKHQPGDAAEPGTDAEAATDDDASVKPGVTPTTTPAPEEPGGTRTGRGRRSSDVTAVVDDGAAAFTVREASPQDDSWTAPAVAVDGSANRLDRRQKGATSKSATKLPPARASARKPEEIRSMITEYRKGLKGSKPSEASKEESEDQ